MTLTRVASACDPGLFPPNLMLAKIRQLVRRGVLDGCACGCRGDLARPGAALGVALSSPALYRLVRGSTR
ncbi:hypothetical protein [Dactylosporangium fulvum]|uniref:Uncharacterized protein n=1 Tax=Dactylosporangium fulvum TaxID=53359 RepID=A0ABY5W8E2_9ACTN|nr:hypothetical protein [Dactylosporangium fulvum]UWP85827.1 hypothetical protein Dfulv_16905 [Dactylosporangium fulvum]